MFVGPSVCLSAATRGTNTDVLERLWTPKIGVLVNFRDFRLRRILKEWSKFSPKSLEIDQDNLRTKLNRCCRASHEQWLRFLVPDKLQCRGGASWFDGAGSCNNSCNMGHGCSKCQLLLPLNSPKIGDFQPQICIFFGTKVSYMLKCREGELTVCHPSFPTTTLYWCPGSARTCDSVSSDDCCGLHTQAYVYTIRRKRLH